MFKIHMEVIKGHWRACFWSVMAPKFCSQLHIKLHDQRTSLVFENLLQTELRWDIATRSGVYACSIRWNRVWASPSICKLLDIDIVRLFNPLKPRRELRRHSVGFSKDDIWLWPKIRTVNGGSLGLHFDKVLSWICLLYWGLRLSLYMYDFRVIKPLRPHYWKTMLGLRDVNPRW